MLIIVGDWNAEVENKAESNVIRTLAKGAINRAADQLMDSCGTNNLYIANTCFKNQTDDCT